MNIIREYCKISFLIRFLFLLGQIESIIGLILPNGGISRIAVLTSGGDCPGINSCIRGIVKTSAMRDIEVWGLPRGLPGLLYDTPHAFKLDETYSSTDMLKKGGSRLGGFVSSDFKEFDSMILDQKASKLSNALENLGIDGIIATGGDTSLNLIGTLLKHTGRKIPFVGIPKTIDNDIPEVIYSIGFQTAVSTASIALANIRDTAESHRRIIVVECMGRKSGYLTLHAGLAGGADTILVPEFSIDEKMLLNHVSTIYKKNHCAVIAVSESITLPQLNLVSTYTTADGSSRLGGSAKELATFLSQSLSVDARHVVLGHIQRGGSANAFDQVLSTMLGAKAVTVLCDGGTNVFVTQNGNQIDTISIDKVRDVPSKSLRSDSPEVLAALSIGVYIGEVI